MTNMENICVLGIDLGATNVRVGRVLNSKVEQLAKCKLPEGKEYNAVIETICSTIDQVITPDVKGIGMGVPSVVERKRGIIYNVQNIPSWTEVPLKDILQQKYNIPVMINNDANCFALGERLFGQGQEFENFVGLAIGTGIGGGIINNGHLLRDVNCGAGEFGEMRYLDARYEDYCSGVFFQTKYGVGGEEIFTRAAAGDIEAQNIAKDFGRHLGNLINTILFAVDPEAIIIGGSIAKAAPYYEATMWEVIKTFTYPKTIERLVIKYSSGDVQVLGSAALYFDATM